MKYIVLIVCAVGCAVLPKQFQTTKHPTTTDSLLNRTNQIRAEYGAPPLMISDSLTQLAQQYAEELSTDCSPENLTHSYRQGVTENLYWRKYYVSATDAVECWYREKEHYQRGEKVSIKKSHLYGHYTAMISKRSTNVGFGWVQCSNGGCIVVAYYYPAGNILNEEP